MDKRELREKIDMMFKCRPYPNGGLPLHKWDEIIALINQLDEPEKVVVPEFVAEFIVDYKEQGYTLANAIFNIATGREDMDIEEYLREHPKKFVQAYDDGFTVEEKKYEVKDKQGCFLLIKNLDGEVINAYGKTVYKQSKLLTEKEIKDYDERFWAFAEEVTN